jgi:hypothetical protein
MTTHSLTRSTGRTTAVALILLLAGCWNQGDHNSLDLGSASLGRQFLDLKAALDAGAISETEYAAVKASLLALTERCGKSDKDADSAQPHDG